MKMLKLSILNVQGWRVIIVVVTGRSSEIIYSSKQQCRRSGKKGNRGWNSVYHQNGWKKLVWVPVIYFLL
jgi:hypothetical protein